MKITPRHAFGVLAMSGAGVLVMGAAAAPAPTIEDCSYVYEWHQTGGAILVTGNGDLCTVTGHTTLAVWKFGPDGQKFPQKFVDRIDHVIDRPGTYSVERPVGTCEQIDWYGSLAGPVELPDVLTGSNEPKFISDFITGTGGQPYAAADFKDCPSWENTATPTTTPTVPTPTATTSSPTAEPPTDETATPSPESPAVTPLPTSTPVPTTSTPSEPNETPAATQPISVPTDSSSSAGTDSESSSPATARLVKTSTSDLQATHGGELAYTGQPSRWNLGALAVSLFVLGGLGVYFGARRETDR